MAYLIHGSNDDVWFVANPRTGSSAIRKVLLENGAIPAARAGVVDHHSGFPQYLESEHRRGELERTHLVQTVRHHCDVLVSYWYKAQRGVEFDYFVNTVLDGNHPRMRPDGFYSHWNIKPNFVLRYENLDFEFANLCGIAGLPDMKIPRTYSPTPEGTKWQSMFTPQLRDKVFERYQTEMELYGYGLS